MRTSYVLAMTLSCLIVIVPILSSASVCTDMTSQINSDITKYSTDLESKQLPWMRLSWLQDKLGPVPAKKTTNNQLKYSWTCRDNSENYLTVIADPEGHMTQISGQYSSESGSGLFQTTLNKVATVVSNVIKTTTTTTTTATEKTNERSPQSLIKDIRAEMDHHQFKKKKNEGVRDRIKNEENDQVVEGIKAYNVFFKTDVRDENQLLADSIPRIKKYFSNLRSCTVGTYQIATYFPLIGYIITTAEIKGMAHHRCLVIEKSDVPMIGKTENKCQYSARTLLYFTDQQAEEFATGEPSFNRAHLTPMQKAMNAECMSTQIGLLQYYYPFEKIDSKLRS